MRRAKQTADLYAEQGEATCNRVTYLGSCASVDPPPTNLKCIRWGALFDCSTISPPFLQTEHFVTLQFITKISFTQTIQSTHMKTTTLSKDDLLLAGFGISHSSFRFGTVGGEQKKTHTCAVQRVRGGELENIVRC